MGIEDSVLRGVTSKVDKMSTWVEWIGDNWPMLAVLAIVGGSVILFFWWIFGQGPPPTPYP